jgi:hypothetical protein
MGDSDRCYLLWKIVVAMDIAAIAAAAYAAYAAWRSRRAVRESVSNSIHGHIAQIDRKIAALHGQVESIDNAAVLTMFDLPCEPGKTPEESPIMSLHVLGRGATKEQKALLREVLQKASERAFSIFHPEALSRWVSQSDDGGLKE